MTDKPAVLREGSHIRVKGAEGKHPHEGKQGRVTEILGVLVKIGEPRAMIMLDDRSGVILVGLRNLEVIP